MKIIECENRDFQQLWCRLFHIDIIQYPSGSPLDIAYSQAYAMNSEFIDRSFIIEERGEALIGVQVSLLKRNGKFVEMSAFGQPVFYLESRNNPPQKLMRANTLLKQKMTDLLHEAPGVRIVYRDFLQGGSVSFLGQFFLVHGAGATPYFTHHLSLLPCSADLKRDVRKSYKSLINWGMKHLTIRVLDQHSISEAAVERFRKLHIQESGRETRSAETWHIQYQQILNGDAFIVFGELSGELVSAAFFHHSDRYCIYGVSASIRALFDKPLSHSILWTAILHAKQIGCSVFDFGEQLFFAQGSPSDKELGISVFKRGFGGETVAQLMIVRAFSDTVVVGDMVSNETTSDINGR